MSISFLAMLGALLHSSVGALDSEADSSLSDLLHGLASLGNTEFNFISDFSIRKQTLLLEQLSQSSPVSLAVYHLAQLERLQDEAPPEPCPVFGTGHYGGEDHGEEKEHKEVPTELYHRDDPKLHARKSLLPSHRYHKSIFVWAKEKDALLKVLGVFNKTIMWCPQKISVGIYQPDTRFYFYFEEPDDEPYRDLFSLDERLRTHAHVASVVSINESSSTGSTNNFAFYTYDFFHRQRRILRYIWKRSIGRTLGDPSRLFTSQDDFYGRHFLIATNPWSHHVLGEEIPKSEGGTATNKYRNYWGYEINMLVSAARRLNFTYTIVNPADGKWGHIEKDGTWSGLVAEAAFGRVDFVICDIFIVYSRSQVFDGTIPFDKDFQTFAAPTPRRLPKYLSLVSPFTILVWISLAVSCIAIALVLCVIANAEGAVSGGSFKDWSVFKNSGWYCYGTLMGEAITRDTKSTAAFALRWVIAVWILYCMIVSASYAGNLKAYLTTPAFTSPINTLAEVLKSGLPWQMVLYGEEEEEMMAQSQDSVIKAIWTGKQVVDYAPTPKIEGVYRGENVFIDWTSGLEPAIFVRYSTPSGQPLIHKSANPVFMPNLPGWGFFSFNPWRPRFDHIIRLMLEAGLIDVWKHRTWVRMKIEASKLHEPIEIVEKAAIEPLTADHLQGPFYLGMLMLAMGLVFFVLEMVTRGFDSDPLAKSKFDGRRTTKGWT